MASLTLKSNYDNNVCFCIVHTSVQILQAIHTINHSYNRVLALLSLCLPISSFIIVKVTRSRKMDHCEVIEMEGAFEVGQM